MDSEEFLKDQVQRLSFALSKYQEKYPPFALSRENDDRDAPPWWTDQNMLSPLLVEYEANNQALQQQIDDYQTAQRELRLQVDKLIVENERLNRELKEAVQNAVERVGAGIGEVQMGGMVGGTNGDTDQALINMQQQLEMAKQEKETMSEMWQTAMGEVERLEQSMRGLRVDPGLQNLQSEGDRVKAVYQATVQELNTEITQLKEELNKTKSELKASLIQVQELRHTLQEMKTQLLRKEQERSAVLNKGQVAEEKVEEVSNDVRTLQTLLEDKTRELRVALDEKRALQGKYLDIQKLNTENENKLYESQLRFRDAVQMSENAMMEKDQAMVREQQEKDQKEKLNLVIANLMDEAGERTRKEVDTVRGQCNENIARLMEEIHHLELESSEKQAQLDRAVREKRSVESELEKLYQEGIIKGTKDGQAYEDMNRRACNAERLRQEAETKLDVCMSQLKRTEATYLDEKTQLQQELEQLKDRMDAVVEEFETINEDRVKGLEEIDTLKRKLQTAQQEKDSAQRSFTKQMTCMERDQSLKAQDYEVRLQTLEDAHRSAMMDLRQMLSSQQRMSDKWKEECQTITHKFEVKVNDLRAEVTRLRQRNEELNRLLKESQEKTKEATVTLAEYTRAIQRMEDRVREAENRANTASAQISKQMSKARNLMFSTSVPSNTLGSSNRSHGGTEALNLSDLQTGKNGVTFSNSTRGGEDESRGPR